MGTKTIGLQDDAYERLKARKREDESFTDLVERLLDEAKTDWREGFGSLSSSETDDLERAAGESRDRLSAGLASRQRDAIDALRPDEEDVDETT